jgi:parallel beta-helix repeat protein
VIDMPLRRRDFLHGVLALPGLGAASGHGPRRSAGGAVRTGEELRAALAAAVPGATILLAPGDFGDVAQFELAVPGVTLRAAVPLRSTLRAPLQVAGDRARIVDLAFRGDGDGGFLLVAIAACRDSLSITASDVEVKGCDFARFPQRAILVRPSGLRPYIHGCGFHDNVKGGGGGGGNAHEAISLGYDNPNSKTSMKARVVGNRFWNLNVEGEAVSVKSSDNTLQGNQLSSSRGGFTSRYGARNTFSGNTCTNSRGIAVGGRGCRIVGNRINGTGRIAVQAGDAAADSTTNGVHPQSADTLAEGNTGQLVIGGQYRPMPALSTTVRRHSGSVRLLLHSGTRM